MRCEIANPIVNALDVDVIERYAEEGAQKIPERLRFGKRPMLRASNQASYDLGSAPLRRFVRISNQPL